MASWPIATPTSVFRETTNPAQGYDGCVIRAVPPLEPRRRQGRGSLGLRSSCFRGHSLCSVPAIMESSWRPLQMAVRAAAWAVVLAGCQGNDPFFRNPSAEPIERTISTTVPLAYAASVAMASVHGSPPSNALSTNTCSSFPCAALVTILVDGRTPPMASGSYGSGQILVTGLWTSSETAILTVAFVDLFVGSTLLRVRDVSTFPAVTTPGGLTIVYESMDVNVQSGPNDPSHLTPEEIDALFLRLSITPSSNPAANVALNAWVVDVDDAGTPSDFSDDRYTISGGGESIDATADSGEILQLGMVGTVMAPGCALNPVEGVAVLNDVGASTSELPVLATALIDFEPACTGEAKVVLATGNYLLSMGETIAL
jgi:hypothetical protein